MWLLWNKIPVLTEGRQKGHMLGTSEKTDFMEEKKTSPVGKHTKKQVSTRCLCPASLGNSAALPDSCCLLTCGAFAVLNPSP